ncbi:DUF4864 domain-containing protein [Vineibacter terrae]|uniref:DUF4864 domain-containing protein n=1 Tax=Vineibacter terrae TaxID=2586908 RepID=UPI001C49A469|nr:DUF4864 domain-containing protein [Vineibacter terrae]
MIRHNLLSLWVLLALSLAGTVAQAADPPGEDDRAAIQAVIDSQIAAFRRDDGEAAFSYAAPAIRHMFGTVDNFMAMVRGGYRPVYRPQAYHFGAVAVVDGQIVQKVHIVGPDGGAVTAFYIMEQQPDGSWRIAGCSLGAPEERSA